MGIEVRRSSTVLRPDVTRVIGRTFLPGAPTPADAEARLGRLVERVAAIEDAEVEELLTELRGRFTDRHRDLDALFDHSFEDLSSQVEVPPELGAARRTLLGAYVSHEYALEGAALTNPSIVPHLEQEGVPEGSLRVLVTLRAVGEGHISSIEFRTGLVDADGDVTVDEPDLPAIGAVRQTVFDRAVFEATMREVVGSDRPPRQQERRRSPIDVALDQLPERFTPDELEAVIRRIEAELGSSDAVVLALRTLRWLAASNYEIAFPASASTSSRVLFPSGPSESHGMEDARFVRFERHDGSIVYYGTYTAYDGYHVLPQLIVTEDLRHVRVATMSGSAARNKGIALFPRLVGGRFAALARSDNENNYVMFSDHDRIWDTSVRVQLPVCPWELVQIGNCGSPLETEAGWLVVTHGVGPMRTYALGALLLDLEDPTQVLGHLREPLLLPAEDERDGYVPNVVYSCGQLVHAGRLVLAYGASDRATRFASVDLDELLTALADAGVP
jgi:predicted GH43/DUF377 family glycosyl hydrolase